MNNSVVVVKNDLMFCAYSVVIILFIGQQHCNVSNGIPPSEFPNVGSLVFNNEHYQSTDDLNSFINDDLAPTKCLFITQSPYSAGMLQQAAKSI